MDWNYIAGYGDGESSLMFGINHDKRQEKIKGTNVDGWTITPTWSISSMDYSVLENIFEFLNTNGIKCSIYLYPNRREYQSSKVMRISIFGWNNIEKFINNILPYSISKNEQYKLFLELKHQLKDEMGKFKWTKKSFIDTMDKIDTINSLKNGKRGKYNKKYFEEMWM